MYEGRPHTQGDLHTHVRGQRATFTPTRPPSTKNNNSEKRFCENLVAVTAALSGVSVLHFFPSGVKEPPPFVAVLARRASSCRNVSCPCSYLSTSSVAIAGTEGGAARLANTKQSRRQRTASDTSIWRLDQLLYPDVVICVE